MMTIRWTDQLRALGGLAVLLPVFWAPIAVSDQTTADTVERILERYVADFRTDRSLRDPVSFSIQIADAHWTVEAVPGASGAPHRVELRRGDPTVPTFYFRMDEETLMRIDRGDLNPLTASVQTFATDAVPLRVGLMEGVTRSGAIVDQLQRTLFHFWTRGFPEMIPFGPHLTRQAHGTDAVVLYYQSGFRSAWFSLKPGDHANRDPRSQVNPFPTMIVITSGRGLGRIGGVEIEGRTGQAFLVPGGTAHEFWNPFDEPVEGLLLMLSAND